MKDKDLVRSYVNNFRRHMAAYLLPGVGLKSSAVLAKEGGGIVKFSFVNGENTDEVQARVSTVAEALERLNLRSFGDVQGVTFSGTNTVLEGNSIFLIKSESEDLWDDAAAKQDVNKIVHSSRSAKK